MEWTEQRIDMLRKLWGQGQTASQIATLLGGVTRNAVIGKAHRLGLTGRPSPIKREGAETTAPRRKSATAQRRQQPGLAPMPQARQAMAQTSQSAATAQPGARFAAPPRGQTETRLQPRAAEIAAPKAPRTTPQAGSKSCSWPVGDPKQPGFHFCSDAAEAGRPYCAHHCAIAYHRKSEAA